MYDLSTFRLERILNNNTKSKTISLLGTFPSQREKQQQQHQQQSQETIAADRAIVVLEKTAFTDDDVNTNHHNKNDDDDDDDHNNDTDEKGLQRRYFSLETQLKQEFINDIYGNFLCYPQPAINSKFHHSFLKKIHIFLLNKICSFGACFFLSFMTYFACKCDTFFFPSIFAGVKLTIICPCTEKHIQKYTSQSIRIVYETLDLFKTVTEPRLQSESEQFTLDVSIKIMKHAKRMHDRENFSALEVQSRDFNSRVLMNF